MTARTRRGGVGAIVAVLLAITACGGDDAATVIAEAGATSIADVSTTSPAAPTTTIASVATSAPPIETVRPGHQQCASDTFVVTLPAGWFTNRAQSEGPACLLYDNRPELHGVIPPFDDPQAFSIPPTGIDESSPFRFLIQPHTEPGALRSLLGGLIVFGGYTGYVPDADVPPRNLPAGVSLTRLANDAATVWKLQITVKKPDYPLSAHEEAERPKPGEIDTHFLVPLPKALLLAGTNRYSPDATNRTPTEVDQQALEMTLVSLRPR